MGRIFQVVTIETNTVLRETSTVVHAVKHGAYAAELQISVKVVERKTQKTVIELHAIDDARAIKPKCKRDKRYVKKAGKGKGK